MQMPKPTHTAPMALAGILACCGPASAASLTSSSSAGDTAPIVATCLHGSYAQPGDLRGCADSQTNNAASAVSPPVSSWASSQFPDGTFAQAWATGSFGSLHAFAESTVPAGTGIGHNAQSQASVTVQDTLPVTSSLGSLFNNYQFTVKIEGIHSVYSGSFVFPDIYGIATVLFNISAPGCTGCNGLNWSSPAYDGTFETVTYTGTIGVPTGSSVSLSLNLIAQSSVGTLDSNQSGHAYADFGNTVQLNIDALTPGASTVGSSGHDYATAVPEPATAGLWLVGLAGLAAAGRRRLRAQPV